MTASQLRLRLALRFCATSENLCSVAVGAPRCPGDRFQAGNLSTLISAEGSQALLARALHLARVQFSYLHGVRAGRAPEACLEGLAQRLHELEPGQANEAVTALLGTFLDLLIGFIGEDLSRRLVREVWPDLPLCWVAWSHTALEAKP
jgi:hypothetical protein